MGFTLGEITGLAKPPKPQPVLPEPVGLCPRGKQMYARDAAERLLQYMNAHNHDDDGIRKMNRYRCGLCLHWHIGHRR